MRLIEEIEAAYRELRDARTETHVLESVVAEFKEKAVRENFEDLKSARSVEARNQAIAVYLQDDDEYQQAREDLDTARLRFDLAKDGVDRAKLLARMETYDG